MCGINGFNFEDIELIKKMNQSLEHRGPNGKSFHIQTNLSLGHVRLSIIDLSNAAIQPMFYYHKQRSIRITFNGEIFNYIEIRNQLLIKGYYFNTVSDTEVIMAAYIEWGEDCVREFNGMWSFCIYDIDKNILFCSRDRFGKKPFYYYQNAERFVFSSELKAILKHDILAINKFANISKDAVELYFSLGFIPSPLTIYKNVYKLNAGHNLIFDLSEKKINKIYSFYKINSLKKCFDKNILIEEGRYLLKDAIKLRLRSDVPVGAFLSGGLDSSAIVGEMKNFVDIEKIHTFSIGFEEKKYDESYYINLAKDYFESNHHHHIYNQEDFNSTWSNYSKFFDEPFGDYSSFPSFKVCEMAKKDVKVVLSGDGGDEIFGGYPIYNTGYILNKLMKLPQFSRRMLLNITSVVKKKDTQIEKFYEVLKLSLNKKENFYSQLFANSRYKPEIYKNWTSLHLREALQIADNDISEALRIYDLLSNTIPDNYLVKVDRTSMANSIEVRSPFLDYRFIEYAQKIPNSYKVGFKNNKILMREIIKDIVPKEILNRNKMGFTPPINLWLDKSISPEDFLKFTGYLAEISEELHMFYKKLFLFNSKNYMFDFYKIKLAIFGKWLDYWIFNDLEK